MYSILEYFLYLMCFLNMCFWVPISVVLWVTDQAMEQEVNPALDIVDSQMKCLIAKVHRSKAVEPEVSSVVKSLQFMSCICLSLPWCLVRMASTWHLSISLRQQTFSPVKVYNCMCLLIFLFRLSLLWVFCSLILSPLMWRGWRSRLDPACFPGINYLLCTLYSSIRTSG